jgi:hypothetical protein
MDGVASHKEGMVSTSPTPPHSYHTPEVLLLAVGWSLRAAAYSPWGALGSRWRRLEDLALRTSCAKLLFYLMSASSI